MCVCVFPQYLVQVWLLTIEMDCVNFSCSYACGPCLSFHNTIGAWWVSWLLAAVGLSCSTLWFVSRIDPVKHDCVIWMTCGIHFYEALLKPQQYFCKIFMLLGTLFFFSFSLAYWLHVLNIYMLAAEKLVEWRRLKRVGTLFSYLVCLYFPRSSS